MKSLSSKKKLAIFTLLFAFILSVVCAFSIGGVANVKAATNAEIKLAYQTFLSTYEGSNPETDFIKSVESDGGAKYFSRGGYLELYDILTDEGIAMVHEVFGVDANDLIQNGGTIGSANNERWTGSFVSESANNVPAGGASIEEGDFSLIVMGDQQSAVEYHSAMVASSYDWIVENAEDMNLKMFINVGDIVDDTKFVNWRQPSGNPYIHVNFHPGRMGSWKWQQKFAAAQADKLLNAGIKTAFTMGNHDYSDMAESYRIKSEFLADFPISKYNTVANGFGGSLYNDIEAAWYEFEANGQDYMVIVIGCYPTTEILDWANTVVSEHPDHKVIVSTHAYIAADTTNDLRPEGKVIWDTFASQHENIFMLVNGHECTNDGSIVNRVDYGVNGNPVTQLMINPQVEEFGGAGTFAQLIFRADGTVDLVYYNPYSNEHNGGKGYFMDVNQYTFSLNPSKINVAEDDLDNENVVDRDYFTNSNSAVFTYFGHDKKIANPTEGVYAYNNVLFTENGLKQKETGTSYVVHKLYAGEFCRFNKLSVSVVGDFIDDGFGIYQVEFSFDGENYTTVLYNNSETGVFEQAFDMDRFAAGAEYLYVRLSIQNANIAKLILEGGSVKTVYTDKTFMLNYNFANDVDGGSYKEWDMSGAYSKYYACLSGNILGSGGAGRMSTASYVTYRFDSGANNRYFEEFNVDFQFRAQWLRSQACGYDYTQSEGLDYILVLSISIDDGVNFVPIKQFTEEMLGVDSVTNTKDCWINETLLSDDIIETKFDDEKITSFILKIDYIGAGPQRAHAGLYNLNLSGTLNKSIKVDEQDDYVRKFELNGGYYENKMTTIPKKSGHEFKGWYLTADFSGAQINPADYPKGDYTFYARWERAYYITYVLDGGVNAASNVTVLNSDGYFVLTGATKEGKTFVGWYDAEGKVYTSIKGGELSEDLVLYAVWEDGETSASGCNSTTFGNYLFVIVLPLIALVLINKKKKINN